MQVRWTTAAIISRNAIIDFIALDNVIAALEIDERINSVVKRLSSYPMIGKDGRIAGTRELVFHEHYLLVYEVVDDTIFIITLLHTSQQWPPLAPIVQ